jgi:hypothetical protein
LPDTYQHLEKYTNKLPFQAKSPAHPFGGFVVNFCVATVAHRDLGDDGVCVVSTIKKRCVGGQICFYEPGFVLESRDWVSFPSRQVTHFNLHFVGMRASLVLHTDSAGNVWVENYNDWEDHIN